MIGLVDSESRKDPERKLTVSSFLSFQAYRKEAIYRQMRQSRRELARADRKVQSLQQSLSEVEERTGAFNHFWDLLVEDIRILFQNDQLDEATKSPLYDVLPFTAGQPSKSAFTASIQERGTAIKSVLTKLASAAPSSQTPEVGELQARCHRLADEASTLRQQSSQTQHQLARTTSELQEITEALRTAERRVDRLQSRTVLLSERPSIKAEEEAEKAKVEAAEAEERAAVKRRQEAEASTSEASASGQPTNGHTSQATQEQLDHLNQLSQVRLEEADQLRAEVVGLRQECERLQLDLHRIPEDRTRETGLYRDLHGHFTHAQQELEKFKATFEAVEAENNDLRERRVEFEANAQAEAFSVADNLREQLKGRDADVARLRAQRDDLNAEVADKRQKESIKLAQVDEMKQLVASKDLRLEALRSEVRRLQMTLAAQKGDSAMVESLKSEGAGEADVELIASLQERLKIAESLASDLQSQATARGESATEAELLAKVASLQKDLDSLNAILQGASSAEEVSSRLKQQQDQIGQLQGELTAANESTNALCEEVEKLSKAYSDMNQQASSKVMDLSKMEEKVLRLTTEKAKADNKYFAAMRSKDALDNDRRTALRTVERQVKAIERYAEAEQQFTTQLTAHEREVTSLRKMISGYTSRIAELERDLKTSRMKEAEAQQHRAHAEEKAQVSIAEVEAEKAKRIRIEERFQKMERDLEKAKKQLAASASNKASASGSSSTMGDSEVDFLQALLRCSSCKDRYREKIITKCLHTFCGPCIDARIQTRQRKCPHCASSFATSDVQPLYLQ